MSLSDDHPNLNPTGFDPEFATTEGWYAMYRAAGFQVVPCKDKRPDLSRWADFQENLVADVIFKRWAGTGNERKADMGMITGPCSGNTLVLDLDVHTHPEAQQWWQNLIDAENSGIEPETVEQITGGGGRQKLFRAPPGYRVPTNRTGIGVDIRGHAGFAVLPPTKHASGNVYDWASMHGPWEYPIADAPQWLLDAIEALVGEHGGHQSNGAHTASPDADYDAFGNVQDGREVVMRDCVWRAILERYRDSPIKPPDAASMIMAKEAYEGYERKVTSRLPDVPLREGLEQEGRGPTAFYGKWRATMRHWGSDRMKAEAARPNPKQQEIIRAEPPKIDPETGKPFPLVLTAAEFVAGFTPPAYLIDGMVQRGYLYSMTARTHHGKTAIAMYISQAIARGEEMHGRKVKGGTVLFLAGENPDDIRARYLVLAETYGFEAEKIKMRFIAGVVDITARIAEIKAAADAIPDLMLVVVDTAAAYFLGDETNSNAQQGAFARVLRGLTFLNGKPAVLCNCHPVKNAIRENLVPMGGSAFLNEVDGNLTLWANSEKQVMMHWLGKFRGPEFNPIAFELSVASSPRVKDAEGRLMPSVVAKPISEMTLEAGEVVQESDENKIMRLIYDNPKASFSTLAEKAGFMSEGQPNKGKVQRIVDRLKDDKMLEKHRGWSKYRLTKKGEKEIGVTDDD